MKIKRLPLLSLLSLGLGLACLPAKAEVVTAVNLTSSSIDFSVNGGAGPLMGPNEDGSGSGRACCASMPPWSPNLTVEVKWKEDKDPYSYGKNPYKRYSKEWINWRREDAKKNVSYHLAKVKVPQYTKQTADHVIAIFLPCHQVRVVNTSKGWKQADFPEKATIIQHYQALTALEKARQCPALQYPAKTSSY